MDKRRRIAELKRDLENAKHPSEKARLKHELDAALKATSESAVRKLPETS